MYWEEPIPAEKTAAIFEEKNKQAKELAALQESNRKNAALGQDRILSPTKTILIENPMTP